MSGTMTCGPMMTHKARVRAKKHRQVVRAVFVRGLPYAEAAKEVGYTERRARQICDEFMKLHGNPDASFN